MAGLLEPYIPNFGDWANTAKTGYALGDTMRRRNVQVEAGGLAAGGNLRGARDALYRGGEIDDGFKIDDRMMATTKAAKTEQIERAAKVQGMIGNLAMMADTPEKWGKAIEAARGMGLDVGKYADFSAREVALAQTGKVAEFLKMELERRKVSGEAGGKPPSGYRWAEGGELEAIPGGPATDLSGDQAGRLAMMKSAQKDLPQAKALYAGDQGISGRVAQLFNVGKTGEAERTVQQGVESAIRAMTGAAATSEETARYMKIFAPSIYDGPKTRKDKLRRLEEFMKNAEEVLMRGRGGKPAPAAAAPTGGDATRIDLGKGTQQPGAGPGKSPKEMSDDELRKSLGL